MTLISIDHAIRAARAGPTTLASAAPGLLVVGGGGTLGSAILERALASRRFGPVEVLATREFRTALRGLEPVVVDRFDATPDTAAPRLAEVALVVFDRARHANGRELAFARPEPQALPTIAHWLWRRGVRSLIVVMPHVPARLPDALKIGLADLDEQAVSALGFEHLVFVRSAQAPPQVRAGRWLQRVANGMLAQMRLMVAASNQPVRASKVAQFAVELAAMLPRAAAGTRIAPPELVWQAAQVSDPAALVAAWLAGRELPAVQAPRKRM